MTQAGPASSRPPAPQSIFSSRNGTASTQPRPMGELDVAVALLLLVHNAVGSSCGWRATTTLISKVTNYGWSTSWVMAR